MKKKVSVSEFAAEVGTTAKTIYERIKKNSELPLNEQLETVNEKVKGREVTLINTDTEQIELYKNIYGKENVINSEYYETLTDINGQDIYNNGYKPPEINNINNSSSDMFDKLITINNEYNNRIDTVRNELFTVQKQLMESEKRTLLLEDRAGREGLYLTEIDDLKKELKIKNNFNKLLLTLIIVLTMVIITAVTYFITVNNMQKNIETKTPEKIEAQVSEDQPKEI